MVAAQVPVALLDSAAILQTARCLDAVDECEERFNNPDIDAKTRFQYLALKVKVIAECGKWLERICATPGSRIRIGVKPVIEKKPGRLQQIMERKGQL